MIPVTTWWYLDNGCTFSDKVKCIKLTPPPPLFFIILLSRTWLPSQLSN